MFSKKFSDMNSAVREGMTLEQVRDAMLQLMADENTNHHRMGQLYNYVVDKKLAENARYKDAREYFSKHMADLSQSALSMYGAVAKAFSEQVGMRFGVTCLYLLLTYKEAAELQVNHEEPGSTVIEVPGENGAVTSKPFSACSVEEMRKAIQRKRKPASSKPLPQTDVDLADQYREVVMGRFGRGVSLRMQLRNDKGKPVVDIEGVPLEQMGTLGEALTSELPRRVEKVPTAA
jgi:hypothetical protein